MALHVLGHVDADQRVLVAEQELGQRLGQLGLADAGRAEEDERADGPLGVLEAGARPPHGAGDGVDGLVLADDALVQRVLHLQQALRSPPAAMLRHRDAGPDGDDLGDVLLGDRRGVSARRCRLPVAAQLRRARPRAADSASRSSCGALVVLVVDGRLLLLRSCARAPSAWRLSSAGVDAVAAGARGRRPRRSGRWPCPAGSGR